MSPTFRLDVGQLDVVPWANAMQEFVKRKNRGTGSASFKLWFHVPVGALKFSKENHVGSSSVQQTLAMTGIFIDSVDVSLRRALEGDAGRLG